MSNPQKYDAPTGAPPGYTPSESTVSSPAPAHMQMAPAHQDPSYPYNTSQPHADSYGQNNSPYGQQPQMGYQQQPQGGYYGPQGGYPQNGGYPNQGYGPGPYGPPQGAYYGQPGYRPQGQYVDDRRGGSGGVMEGLLAGLACCCCLDCLLF